MSTLGDLEKLLAIANLKVLSSSYSGDGAKAELERLADPIAQALVESQEALEYLRMHFGGEGWPNRRGVGTLSDAAAIRGVAALRMDALERPMEKT